MGIVIFVILVAINFIIITKGASRVAEVSARCTMDAMPGKQMAIDADLNAGSISEEEARKRREEISQESDFFGAMDGASKFVRGGPRSPASSSPLSPFARASSSG
ncbi:MAG: FHIPEP family type III secretion protein [Desulfohalobiaceae bacterium]